METHFFFIPTDKKKLIKKKQIEDPKIPADPGISTGTHKTHIITLLNK